MWPDDDSEDKAVLGFERPIWIVVGVLTVAINAGAVFIMVDMDASSRSQGGRYYIAVAALIVMTLVISPIQKLVKRLGPLRWGTSGPEQRFAGLALIVSIASAVFLIWVAWLLP